MPGRVVWSYDPASVEWDGSGYWWDLEHFDEAAIQSMVRSGIASLAGEQDAVSGWDSLFRAHNTAHGSSSGYQSGQKIAIKANMNGFGTFGDDSSSHMSYTNPMVLKTLLVSLVTDAGVAPQNITVYDASRLFPQEMMSICTQGELSGVQFRYMDLGGPNDAQPDTSAPVVWSQSVSGADNYLPTCVTEADYLINLAELKGHSYGITLTGKNHFGTLMNSSRLRPPEAAGIHRYLTQNRMDAYTVLVDLMGSYQLGEKTMLYMLDAIICAPSEGASITAENSRWQQVPFDGDYTSSLFFSQDPVAIDSVGADFLINEPTVTSRNSALRDNPNVENYLHEAGLVATAPSGTAYYNGDGERITNLGVHEHWNNPTDKQYSRNLGADRGIELIQAGSSASNPDHTETPVTQTIFHDVPTGAWYAGAVAYCHQQGLMSGVSDNTFAPAETVSRGMLAAILYRQAGSPAAQISATFPDVPANIWYSNAVAWAAQNGMMSGYADGRFGPNNPVTREQIAAILWRHAGTPQSDTAEEFSDHSAISAYALDAANWARDTGVISGDSANRFRPKSAASRAELAVILYRYLSHEMG
ncbi:MAG: S-layer homology domain-containing protein [Oscillospiraceae bacterium]|nr:S-layer homology domain-containing protein [Oscillospiraceae bacterium]